MLRSRQISGINRYSLPPLDLRREMKCKQIHFISDTHYKQVGTHRDNTMVMNTHKMTFLTTPEKPVCEKVTISTNYPHTGKTRGGHCDMLQHNSYCISCQAPTRQF